MSLTTTITSNQPGGSGFVGGLSPMEGSVIPGGGTQSSPASIASELLQEFQQMMQSAGGASSSPAMPSPMPSPMPAQPSPTNLLATPGALPATGTTMPGTTNTNLSSVQLQVGTSGGGTTLAQGPKNADGSSDLYLPQKDGSEKHVGKEMADGSIKFDNSDAAKSVLGKGGDFMNSLGGNLKSNSDGTETLAAGASTLTAGNLPAPV